MKIVTTYILSGGCGRNVPLFWNIAKLYELGSNLANYLRKPIAFIEDQINKYLLGKEPENITISKSESHGLFHGKVSLMDRQASIRLFARSGCQAVSLDPLYFWKMSCFSSIRRDMND
jgi:hypothetical protein